MRCDFELKIRCRDCNANAFVQVFTPTSHTPPTNAAVRALAAKEIDDFECKACGGHSPWVVSIYGIKEDRRRA